MAPRSRTGCLTCRQRKLKCSEERPICAQCAKARRECIPSSGITFRHQQNPSMNGDPVSRESLKNFYGYKETFTRDSVWMPIPRELTFITTNNPYEDEDGSANPSTAVDDAFVHNGLSFDVNRDTSDGEFARQLAQAAYPQAEYSYPTHGLEALSAVASSQDQYNYAPPPAPMAPHDTASTVPHGSSPQQSHETLMQSLDSFVHGSQHAMTTPPPNIDPRLGAVQPQQHIQQQQHHDEKPIHVRTSSYTSVRPPSLHLSKGATGSCPAIREPDVAFLMRDFSEHAGAWMDLFDLGQFFAMEVPLLAAKCPLLLYACTALSAKSISRVVGNSSILSEADVIPQKHHRLASWPGASLDAEGWVRKGRENYDLAVSLLRQALAGATMSNPADLPEFTTEGTASATQDAPLPNADSDKLVAATAILCVYEFLDASGSEWSRHLDGAKSLFEVAKEKMTLLTTREPEPLSLANQIRDRLAGHDANMDDTIQRGPSRGRTAIFWNFARQDMLSAFINNTNTRLDTTDIPMWSNAGLNIDPQGYLYPSNPSHPNYLAENAMSDDKISNALIWLLMKLVNYIAAGDEMPSSFLGVRQHDLLTYWHQLDSQLKHWHDGLPHSFRAIALGTDAASGLEERWFPRPMCASTMQSYHFARIQLLHNKPHISTGSPFSPPNSRSNSNSTSSRPEVLTPGSSLAARHASYASILQQSRFHAKKIVAISLGRTDEAMRIHTVQPLWTAGLVLGAKGEQGVDAETETWRKTIVDLLRGVERDLGWASEYRVSNLLDLWKGTEDGD